MKILAHRGFWRSQHARRGQHASHDERAKRENTVDAYLDARLAGVDGVELDVRRSHDGALVVFHDPVIEDIGPITEIRVPDLPPWIPLLDDALNACAGSFVNIEVKVPHFPNSDQLGSTEWAQGPAIASEVVAVVDAHGARQSVLVSSFDLRTVDAVKAIEPDLPTGLLIHKAAEVQVGLNLAAERGHNALHPRHSLVTSDLVQQTHDAGLDLFTWTVNARNRIEHMRDLGVDCLITDVPDVALAVTSR
jgi:glycerophosphoryl diester phosphodiesterase